MQEPTQQAPSEEDDTGRAIAPGRRWAAGAWAVLVAMLLLVPGSSVPAVPWWVPTTFGGWIDSFVHAFLFLVQMVLVERAVERRGRGRERRLRVTVVLGWAFLLELLQIPVPGRSFQFIDLLFAAVGVAIALAAVGRRARE